MYGSTTQNAIVGGGFRVQRGGHTVVTGIVREERVSGRAPAVVATAVQPGLAIFNAPSRS